MMEKEIVSTTPAGSRLSLSIRVIAAGQFVATTDEGTFQIAEWHGQVGDARWLDLWSVYLELLGFGRDTLTVPPPAAAQTPGPRPPKDQPKEGA